MKDWIIKVLLHIIVWLRRFTSPILYKLFYKNKGNIDLWNKAKTLSMEDFSNEINKYEYKWDSFKGLLDASFSSKEPQYFFGDLEKGRDCDDFARVWRLWGEANGYKGYEYIVTDPNKPFGKAHVVAVLEKDGYWWLMNYKPYGPFTSRGQAITYMSNWYSKLIFIWYRSDKELNI